MRPALLIRPACSGLILSGLLFVLSTSLDAQPIPAGATGAAGMTATRTTISDSALQGSPRIQNVEVVALDPESPEAERLAEGLPLRPERLLRMTVQEGSWMSLDVSPDGSTLVFDLLGSIWTLPIGGGEAKPLTQGMAFDAQPRFSPDGTRIVFVSDRTGGENVFLLSLDLTDTIQLTRGNTSAYQSPVFTPDGQYVVVTRQAGSGQGKLHQIHVEGGAGTTLISEPANLRTTGAAFSADGRTLWYAQRTGAWQYNSALGDYQLATYDRDTGETRTETNRYGGAFRPVLSPDGRWLVYGTRHVADTGLRIRDLATDEERWLAFPVQRDDMESRATRDVYPGMAFTPDSRELVATYGGRIWRIPVDGSAPREVPFTAQVELAMGPEVDFQYPIEDTPVFTAKQIRDAVPSPDGSQLAFTALGRLYVMDSMEGTPRQLTDLPGNQHAPVWTPDGQALIFVNWDFDEGGHLWRVPARGGDPERLTVEAAFWQQPTVTPDGTRIVVLQGPARAYVDAITQGVPFGARDLVWLPAQGGETTPIRRAQGLSVPHVIGDGTRIYASGSGGRLLSFRWDGTDERVHLTVTGPAAVGGSGSPPASLVRMSPDGRRALAQHGLQLYSIHVPDVGGAGPTINVSNPANAAFPVRPLTDLGGQFPVWSADGRRIHWSLGAVHSVYDLALAEATSASTGDRAPADGSDTHDAGATEPGASPPGDSAPEPLSEYSIAVEVVRDIPRGDLVLSGARIITMRGDEVLEQGDIHIRDNRIVAVGAVGSLEVPEGTEVMDVSGHTILPGFVDTHAHLRAPFNIHRDQPWSYAANLAYGVTTTRDPQTGATDVLTYEDMVRAGRTLGPRVYSTGPGVFAGERIQSLNDARRVLRRYAEFYDTKTIKMYGAGNRATRQYIIQAARELELMPTTEGSLDLQLNMTMGLDGYSGMEHNMPGFPLFGDVAQLVASSTMAYTPTILVTYGGPWAENWFYATEDVLGDEKLRTFTPFEEIQQKALRRPGPGPGQAGWFHPSVHTMHLLSDFVDQVVEAGGRAGVGSHGQLQGLGYHWELWATGAGDRMTPHRTLKVATLLGAISLGLGEDIGSLEGGKLADLVILRQNPLDDLRNTNTLRYVMINGRLHEASTLDEVWPRQRQAGPFYWQNEGPEPLTSAGMR